MDWLEETRLRVLLTFGLGGSFDANAEDEVESETVLVTRVVVPTTIPEDDEHDEDDKTEVGYRESPERVKLEVIEIISGDPISAVGIIPVEASEAVKPEPHSFAHEAEGKPHRSRHAPPHHTHKDEETIVAEEAGV
jgi:hypothetical protein